MLRGVQTIITCVLILQFLGSHADPLQDWLSVLSSSRSTNSALPISFLYNNVPSYKILTSWPSTTKEVINGSRRILTFTYTEPNFRSLQVEITVTLFPKQFKSVAEWVLTFRNVGDSLKEFIASLQTLSIRYPTDSSEDVTLYHQNGSYAQPTDYWIIESPLTSDSSFLFQPEGGVSSNKVLPFYSLDWNKKGGVTIGIGWSGLWQAEFNRTSSEVIVTIGLSASLLIFPGEEMRVARVLVANYNGSSHQVGQNIYRQVVLQAYSPRVNDLIPIPPISAMGYWDGFIFYPQVNESTARFFSQLIKSRPGEEAYWIDCSWFKGAFPDGSGNWALPLSESLWQGLPNGLKPITDICHNTSDNQNHIKFILWVEPERIHNLTWVFKHHFDWLLDIPDNQYGDYLYNLGDNEALDYMTLFLSQIVEQWRVDILRLDFNIYPSDYWVYRDSQIPYAPKRNGFSEIRYVSGLYKMWDDLLKKYPSLVIDNCSSGGRRQDLETISRSITLWRTDFEGPSETYQTITMGLNHFQPLQSGFVGTLNSHYRFQYAADPYTWRSCVTSGAVITWDQHYDNKTQIAMLYQGISETNRLRKWTIFGNFWRLTEMTLDNTAWIAYQYHLSEEGSGYMYFFRRPNSPYTEIQLSLYEIDEKKNYSLEYFYTYDLDKKEILSGSQFANFVTRIPQKGYSLLVQYWS
eukprot:TRINITY_DN10571_c0_g1_i1.p1 TRINITY_DN10571_c0_g1~~TRINITY_DN10571_c0_g1_i1.p1  ORF type:complete len:690 (-),score=89.43 TRINITY_DN10571_c0_g1_i1:3-2072(-)